MKRDLRRGLFRALYRSAGRFSSRRVRIALWTSLLVVGLLVPRFGASLSPELPTPATPATPATPMPATPETPMPAESTNLAGEAEGDPSALASLSEGVEVSLGPSTRAIPFDGGAGKRLIYIEIHDVIDLGLAPFIERVVDDAQKAGDVVAIVSHINTPGGRVDAAVRIRDVLLRSKVPTIAFVDTQAISAGALIAYAHDFIVVAEGASMGAATPIQMGGGGQAEPVEEKITSYMRSVMRATAEAHDRDGTLAEAMVDRSLAVKGVSEKGKLLTGSMRQLLAWGVADLRADSFDALREKMKLTGAEVERPTPSWAEVIARFLTHPVVSSLLMTFGFLGLLMELYTPGFGLAGSVGLACLLMFFAGHLVVKLAGLEELLLFGLGVGLLAVEIFVIPGFGVVGVLGVLAIVASLVLTLIGLPIEISFETGGLLVALGRVSLAALVTVVLAVVALKILPKTGAGRRLVLSSVTGQGGPPTLDHPLGRTAQDRPIDDAEAGALVGSIGRALTDLRPAGRALIEGKTVDVVTEGDYLLKGDRVEVVEASLIRVVVRPVQA